VRDKVQVSSFQFEEKTKDLQTEETRKEADSSK
jgi:hypothetical protein